MPQIGPDLWKTALSFYWWREFADGRVEQEFDPDTGQIRPWGPDLSPAGIVKAGWLPVSEDLAKKMAAFGEFGTPAQSPSISVALKPGDGLEIFKDCQVLEGMRVHCKVCNATFRSFGVPDGCPLCGAQVSWRCPKCDKITTYRCPSCNVLCRKIDPLETAPDKWEEVIYNLGIKGSFMMRFNSRGLLAQH